MLALIALLVLGTGCTRPSVSKCRADAGQFISEVNEHRKTFDTRGQFATALGQVPTTELLDRDSEMISCIASDPRHKERYREALDMNDSVESERYVRFLLDTEQMPAFTEWERQKQAAAKEKQ